jgi:anti-sigma regulatory factor (Ser/Thr protein kinase)
VFEHSVSSGPRAAVEARRYVRDRLATTLNASQLADCELMTSELVTNAVQHAQIDAGAFIGLDIGVEPATVHVSVVDSGEGFHAREAFPDVAGGWGLVLVERMSDRWGISAGTPHSVWFEIDR